MRSIASLLPAVIVGAPVAAATMPLAVAAPVVAPPFVVREYALVMAFGEQIGPMVSAYRAADNARLEARHWAETLSPPVPPELLLPPGHPWRACGEELCDPEGKRPEPETYIGDDGKSYGRMPMKVFNSKTTRAYLQKHGLKHEGPLIRRLIARAEKFERQRLNAIQVSGVREAAADLDAVRWQMARVAQEAAKMQPRTWAGVAILAQLASLPDDLDDKTLEWQFSFRELLKALAGAVLSVSHYAQEGAL